MKYDNKDYIDIILDEAKKIIFESGIKSLNMNILAKRCSLAKATLYKIIDSKDKLIEKVAYDFLIETRIKHLKNIINNENFLKHESCSLEIAKLSIGQFRILQKQIFNDFPIIRNSIMKHWNNVAADLIKRASELQKNNNLRVDIDSETIVEFFKIIFDNYCLSDLSDDQIIKKITTIYKIFIDGLKITNLNSK